MKKPEPQITQPTLREKQAANFPTEPFHPLLNPIDHYNKKRAIQLFRQKLSKFYLKNPEDHPTKTDRDQFIFEVIAAIWGIPDDIPSDEYRYFVEYINWACAQTRRRKYQPNNKKQSNLFEGI